MKVYFIMKVYLVMLTGYAVPIVHERFGPRDLQLLLQCKKGVTL